MNVSAHRRCVVVFNLLLVVFLFGSILHQSPAVAQQSEPPVIARITTRGQGEVEQIVTLGLDLLEARDGDDLFILTTQPQIERLRELGFQVAVDQQQTAQLQRFGISSFMGGYRTVPEMRGFLEQKVAQYPNLARFFVYGKSWERTRNAAAGHDLFGIELTNKLRPEPKPTFFLMAAIHARELTTSEVALRLVDYLLRNYGVDGDATWLLDEHKVVVVPVVNPDGRRLAEAGYYQRKNTNRTYNSASEECFDPPASYSQYGVDLNRNSSFEWGVVNTPSEAKCGPTYPGPGPASEPETAAIEALLRSYFPDQRDSSPYAAAPLNATGVLITLHSYSDLVLWPWGSTYTPAPNESQLALMGRRMAAYNGYTPQQSSDLYPTSGTTDDWAYGELGIAAFTFEIGPDYESPCGGFMPPFSCLDGGDGGGFWPRNLPALLYAAKVARTPYLLVQGPTPETLAAPVTADGINLVTTLDERHNGGQNISAAEYYIDVPPWRGGTAVPMAAADGAFNSTRETVTATLPPFEGRHLVFVRGHDSTGSAGTWGPVRAVWVNGVTAQAWFPIVRQ
jgi:hypothetical protein